MDFDALIVGCGFSGVVAARVLAEEFGLRVLILEKRPHIGGNMYDETDEAGVLVQLYGPHIFHTNSDEAFAFIRPFAEWFPYEHRVLGHIQGKLVPIPFNFTSIDTLFAPDVAARLREKLKKVFPDLEKVTVSMLIKTEDTELADLGQFIFNNVFKNYTEKQWGIPPALLDEMVINRIPVVLSYDDRYFRDMIQMMPRDGFTALFSRLLKHPNITVLLSCDALTRLSPAPEKGVLYLDGERFDGICIYTGLADELFSFCYGGLPFRSLHMVFENLPLTEYQPAAVVNYPNEKDFTRISEFKKITGQALTGHTAIMREYPRPYVHGSDEGGIPYYAVLNDENRKLYSRYAALAARIPNLHLCGRLAEYAYYNMDDAILAAIRTARKAVK